MENVVEHINGISNKEDLVRFLHLLSKDYKNNQEQWENGTIDEFLEGIAGWIEDFSECEQNDIHWESIDYSILARLFYMGKIYE